VDLNNKMKKANNTTLSGQFLNQLEKQSHGSGSETVWGVWLGKLKE
jgi:hypothetical protein